MANPILLELSEEFDGYVKVSIESSALKKKSIQTSKQTAATNTKIPKKRKSTKQDASVKTVKKRKKQMSAEVEKDYNQFRSVYEYIARKSYRVSDLNIISKDIENDKKFLWNQIDLFTDQLWEYFSENENEETLRLINLIRKVRFFRSFSSEHLKSETPRCNITRKLTSKGKSYKIHFEIPSNIDLKTGKSIKNHPKDSKPIIVETTVETEYYNFIRFLCFLQKLEGNISTFVRRRVGSSKEPDADEKLNKYLLDTSDERKEDEEIILSNLKESFTFFKSYMKNTPQKTKLVANISPLWFFMA